MRTNVLVESIGSQLVRSAGPTLKSISANTIAMAKEKTIRPRVITVLISPSSSVSRVATLAEIAAKADRERLAERDDAADDGEPPKASAATSARRSPGRPR